MTKMILSLLAAAGLMLTAAPSIANAEMAAPAPVLALGKPAPDFAAKDISGADQSLAQHKGKIVVLEWTNPECPFVEKHYSKGNMQQLQKDLTKDGDLVWISINSSAAGKEGHLTADEAKKNIADGGAAPSAYIIDDTGAIGKLYSAKTTPHMFVIDKDGALVYEGAIDDNDRPDPAVIKDSKNYVTAAVASLRKGEKIEIAQTKPYGCGVKY